MTWAPGAAADWCCRIAFERFTEFTDLGEAQHAAVSPDGRHLYEARSDGLRVVSIAGNGRLRPVQTLTTLPAAADLAAADLDAWRVIVSPDGEHVYVNYKLTSFAYGMAVYRRNARSGRLDFLQRSVADSPTRGDRMVFSPDGLHLYTSRNSLRVYARNRLTGALALLQSFDDLLGLRTRGPLAISPDGSNVYIASIQSGDDDGLVIFDRDPLTGLLDNIRSLLDGDAGTEGLGNPTTVLFDAAGSDVYISTRMGGVSRYARDGNGDLSFVEYLNRGADSAPPLFLDSTTMTMLEGGAMLAMRDLNGLHFIAVDPVDGSLRFVETHDAGIGGVGDAIGEDVHTLVAAPDRLVVAARDGIGSLRDTGIESEPQILGTGASISDGDAASMTGVVEGIEGAREAVLSPDGRFVYVAAEGEFSNDPSTLAVFEVDRATGEFEQVQFLDGLVDLHDVASLAISPDGKHLYALANNDRNSSDDPYIGSLVVFARDRANGTLAAVQTLVNEGDDGAGNTVEGLQRSRKVRISPNGRSVYVVSSLTLGNPAVGNGTVSVFSRSSNTGALRFVQRVESGEDGVQISNARDIAFTPNSRFAYVAGGGRHSLSGATDHVLSWFRRQSDGSLTLIARVADPGIVRADAVVVSPDARHLYAAENTGFATIRFSIFRLNARTGEATLVARHENGFAGLTVIDSLAGMDISRNGRRLVVANLNQNLALFERDRSTGQLKVLDGGGEERFGAYNRAAFAFDPRTLAVYSADRFTGTLTTFAPRTGPVLTAPSSLSPLPGADVVFRWTYFAGAPRGGRLLVGTSPGADDIASRGFAGGARSLRLRGLPLDGSTLHVTMIQRDETVYEGTFTAATRAAPGLVAPADGSQLSPGRVRFSWDGNGYPVTRWELRIGSSEGADDLYSRRFGAGSRSANVNNLPQDGRDLFVSLLATVNGVVDTTTTALIAALPEPSLSADGSTIGWTPSDGDDGYQVTVGTVPGGADLCDSGALGAGVLSHACDPFPEDGRELFVTLLRTNGVRTTTHTLVIDAGRPLPALASPAPESTLEGHTVVFRFERNLYPVSQWELRVGTRPGASDFLRARVPGEDIHVTVPGLPTLGGEVFARLFWTVDGRRQFQDYRFDAADFELPDLLFPAGTNARVTEDPLQFTWRNPGHDITFWRVDIGTEPGAADVRSIRSDEPNDATDVSSSAGVDTNLAVTGVLTDTNLFTRWTYRIGNDPTERFEDTPVSPADSVCCEIEQGTPVVDGVGGFDGLQSAQAVVVSPDGKHVYATGGESKVTILERNTDSASPDFGALTYLGVWEVSRSLGRGLVISDDGLRLYAASNGRIFVAERDPSDGSLSTLQTMVLSSQGFALAGHIVLSPDAVHGDYLYAVGTDELSVLEVAADGTLTLETTLDNNTNGITQLVNGTRATAVDAGAGQHDVYVGSLVPNALIVLRHDRVDDTITLTQEIVDDQGGFADLAYPMELLADDSGQFIYMNAVSIDQTLVVFQRDNATGALTQLPAFTLPIATLRTSFLSSSLVLGPDGDRLYAVDDGGFNRIRVFERDPVTGEVGNVTTGFATLENESESAGDPRRLAISPDGAHLYLARGAPVGGIAAYRLDETASSPDILQFINAIEEGVGGIDGLNRPDDMAVSPDGRHVYVVGGADNKLAILAYEQGTNELSFVEAIRPDRIPPGLEQPRSVVVSPDGAFVYVASRRTASTEFGSGVMIFLRDPIDGTLTYVDRYYSAGFEFNNTSLAMSADGRHLYRTARNEKRLEVLERNPVTGGLTEVVRYDDDIDNLGTALLTPEKVYVSADGNNVYVLSDQQGTITTFQRDPDLGTLTLIGFIRDGVDGIEGFDFINDLVISRDGRDVYVAGNGRLLHLKRRAGDGLLEFVSSRSVPNFTTIAFHPTAELLYLSSNFGGSSGLATYTRDPATGALEKGPVLAGVTADLLVAGGPGLPLFAARGDTVRTIDQLSPILVAPAAAATLTAQTTRFEWNANGVAAFNWRLQVGSMPGANDFCDSGLLPRAARHHDCSGLPRDGEALYVTLSAGADDAAPSAFAEFAAPDLDLPVLALPVPGTAVSETQAFSLDDQGNDISQWRIRVGTTPGAANLGRRTLAGDASGFEIARLPTDRHVYVSVESRGTYGRETTVYQFNASTAVTPLYPRSGARWGQYVRAGGDILGGSDRACSAGTVGPRDACLHGGEHRVFVVPGVLSCDGVTAADDQGAFDWVCDDVIKPARVISIGRPGGTRLTDLMDFMPPGFRLNRVTVQHDGTTHSDETIWWDNPVEDAGNGGPLPDAGTVYVASQAQPLEPFLIRRRNGVSLVVKPDVELGQAISPGEALVHLERAHFAWVEGALDAGDASFGVKVDDSAWPVLKDVHVSGASVAADAAFAGVHSAGIALNRVRNAWLQRVTIDRIGDPLDDQAASAGIALDRSNDNHLLDVGVSRAGTGITLSRSSRNRLEDIVSTTNEADGLALERSSRDNVVAEAVTSNNLGDGVVIAGRSDGNRLLQVLSRHNEGSGVLIDDASLGNALVGVSAMDNAMHGVELQGAQRGLLAALALSNNGGDGLSFSGARDNLVMDIASAHNAGAGVSLAQNAVRNVFTGELRVGNNASDCVTAAGSGELLDGCVMSGTSDAGLVTGISLVNSWPPDLEGSSAPFVDVTDWLDLDEPWQSWGSGQGFIGPFTRGACTDMVGDDCAAWDARLVVDDDGAGGFPALADLLPLPTVDDLVVHRMRRTERFIPFARELLGDGLGDDDGLCEVNEDCLAMPHLGAYQGEDEVLEVDELANGVRLFRHDALFVPVIE